MTDLKTQTCKPCRGGIPPLTRQEADQFLTQTPDWAISGQSTRIAKTFKFGNFGEALEFVQKVGELAEREFHHPDINFGWGYCTIILQTKKIKGLHENDFIMAAKINQLAQT